MLDRFVRLCEIESPTGAERAVADAVLSELPELGVEVAEDGAAGPARAGAGNLIARLPGPRRLADVRRPPRHRSARGADRGVAQDEGAYRSSGDTILGADNKAAVAVLLELARGTSPTPPPVGSSWSSRSPRRTGCGARRSWTSRRCARLRLRARPRQPDRRGDRGGAHLQAAGGGFRGHERTPGSIPRRATARSPRRPPRSPR